MDDATEAVARALRDHHGHPDAYYEDFELQAIAALDGLRDAGYTLASWVEGEGLLAHHPAASRYAPIRVEASGLVGWVQRGGDDWWVIGVPWIGVPYVMTRSEIEARAAESDSSYARFFAEVAAAAAVASWVAGGTD